MVEGDEIIAVNGVKIQQNLEQWLSYYASQKITLTIFRNHNISEIELLEPNENQFYEYKILTLSNEK
jgi:predicted metalloprotease with PDZ domain